MKRTCLSSRFARDTRGTAAVIYALAIAPAMLMLGFAFDAQRSHSAKLTLQTAVDAAAIAGAREMYSHDGDAIATAQIFFEQSIRAQNGGVVCSVPLVTVNDDLAAVTVSANCDVPSTIPGLVGIDSWNVDVTSTARSTQTKIDLALMLDVSGSMGGSKLADLKTAAKDAVDILVAGAGDEARIALAPYSTAVNTGSYAEAVVGTATYDGARANPDCVTEREGRNKRTDAAPGNNSWTGYRRTATDGANIHCPDAAITPLTSNASDLHDEIDALSANGWTAGQLGIAWSWYMISPEWDAIWPAASKPRAYDAPETIKAVILMTDGSFNKTYDPAQGNSVNQSKAMCREMRDQGIIIYSVAFQAPPDGKAVLADCATSADTYFEPTSGDELKDVYREIATTLSGLRLSD